MLLEEARERLVQAGIPSPDASCAGDVVEAVQETEHDADLIVIGKRGEAADFAKLHLGSNLERVVAPPPSRCLVASRAFKPISAS